jgi:hypothetical protein
MSSVDPKTLAIGGAVIVAGVGAYLLLRNDKGHVADPVDPTAGTPYPDNPYSDNPTVPENEKDDDIPIVGGVVGGLEDAKLKYWINEFREKGYSDNVKNGIFLTKALLLQKDTQDQAVNEYFATVRAYEDEKKVLVSDWVPSHWDLADPLLKKNGNELDALRPQIESVQKDSVSQQIVDQLKNWTPQQREAYLNTLPPARQAVLRRLLSGASDPPVVSINSGTSASTTSPGAGLGSLLSQKPITAQLVDQYFRWPPAQQKLYMQSLSPDQETAFINAVLRRASGYQ